MVRDQVSAISYFSSNLFFHDFNFPARLQLSYSTSTLFHDFNFPAQLTFFSRIQLSCTTSTILHDFNFLARLQLFSRLQLFFTTQHFNFPARPKYSAVRVDWTPLDLDPPVQIRWRMCNPPRPNLLTDLDPPTKLSENIILNVLVEIGNTLRSSAHESKFLILYKRIANAYTIWPLLRNFTCLVIEKNITIIQNRQTAKNSIKTENRQTDKFSHPSYQNPNQSNASGAHKGFAGTRDQWRRIIARA